MSFQFVQGRTNNHLTWVGVDATDFATRESALSAAWAIKIYGTLEGATGVNFVSSGTGSLTNDIVHIGASAAGVYHIALAKADLSDASAAWYDEYIVILSATGAAYETIVVEGVRTDTSYVSNVLSYLSNVTSYLSNVVSYLSNTNSNASNYLSNLSAILSDFQSDFQSRVPGVVTTFAQMSDFHSDLRSLTSGVGGGTASNLASVIWNVPYSNITAASTIGSMLRVVGSVVSDAHSAAILAASTASTYGAGNSNILSQILGDTVYISGVVSDMQSDFQSRVPAVVTTFAQMSNFHSDLRSLVSGITATVSASDISDIASAVWSERYNVYSLLASSFGSFVVQQLQGASNLLSSISGLTSDAHSAAILAASTASTYGAGNSNILSQILGDTVYISGVVSDLQSDFQSRVPAVVTTFAQMSNFHSDLRSLTSGVGGGTASALAAKVWSDFESKVGSTVSDMYSTLAAAAGATPSQVWGYPYSNVITASTMGSMLRVVGSVVSDAHSAAILAASTASTYGAGNSNILSQILGDTVYLSATLSDLDSNFQSRVPGVMTTFAQMSNFHSDLRSLTSGVGGGTASAIAAAVWSDYQSKVGQTPSQVFSNISNALSAILADTTGLAGADVSDMASAVWSERYNVYSLLASSFGSFVTQQTQGLSGVLSDTYSAAVAAASQAVIAASAASNAYSAASQAVIAADAAASQASDAYSLILAAAVALTAQNSDIISKVSDMGSLLSDVDSAVSSQYSNLLSYLVGLSGAVSDVESQLDVTDATTSSINTVTTALTAAAAAKLALQGTVIITGTVDTTIFAATTTEFEADDITEATADHFNGRIILFTSGVLVGQATDITDYALSGVRGHFTVTALTEAPANNVTFIIV